MSRNWVLIVIPRRASKCWGHPDEKRIRHSTTTLAFTHARTPWNISRCIGIPATGVYVTLPPGNDDLTQSAISRPPTRLPVVALAATVESTSSLFCFKSALGHIFYEIPVLLSIHALQRLCITCVLDFIQTSCARPAYIPFILQNQFLQSFSHPILTHTLHISEPFQKLSALSFTHLFSQNISAPVFLYSSL